MISVETKEKKALSRNDATFYRLVVLFVYAIISIVGVNLIRENEIACRKVFNSIYFIVTMAILFVACIVVILKKVLADKVIRLNSIAKVLAPLFFMLAVYTYITNANYKTEIVVIASIVLAFVMIVYPKNYFALSLIVAIEYFALYFIYNTSSYVIDKIFYYASYPISLGLPILALIVLIIAKNNRQFKLGKISIKISGNKATFISAIVLLAVCLLAAVLVIILPITYSVVSIALLATFIVVGVICTIKLL